LQVRRYTVFLPFVIFEPLVCAWVAGRLEAFFTAGRSRKVACRAVRDRMFLGMQDFDFAQVLPN